MIKVKQFVFNDFSENTYLIYDATNQCIIVDPGCNGEGEFNMLYEFLNENSLKPYAVINTHGHIDHILGCARICSELNTPFFLHQADEPLLQRAKEQAMLFGMDIESIPEISSYLSEQESIKFGNSEMTVLHIPGHSPGSVALYSKAGGFVIAGDILFDGSIGRTDLFMGNHEQLIEGIRSKLLILPRNTIVYPGHGPSTTIGKEYDTNPFLI